MELLLFILSLQVAYCALAFILVVKVVSTANKSNTVNIINVNLLFVLEGFVVLLCVCFTLLFG